MIASDYLIGVGPGAGHLGGEVVTASTPEKVTKNLHSSIGQCLSRKKVVPVSRERRKGSGKVIKIASASENNLKNINVESPLSEFAAVIDVLGSGKSTLVNQILREALAQRLNRSSSKPGKHRSIIGYEAVERTVDIDQSPVGRTPRNNPMTYTSVFDDIHDLFTQTNEARVHDYEGGRFGLNVKGGRCKTCRGDGIIRIEIHFLPSVYVSCEVCHGKCYSSETLKVHYKNKDISDILDMTVEDAIEFSKHIPKIHRKLQAIVGVSLGYVTLGQPATTLSGGETQWTKLASKLYRNSDGKNLYILDELTTGLYTDNIARLLLVLKRLMEAGNTVLVIKHNPDIIKSADHVISLEPEGDDGGGMIMTTGTLEEVVKIKDSYAGYYLKRTLK